MLAPCGRSTRPDYASRPAVRLASYQVTSKRWISVLACDGGAGCDAALGSSGSGLAPAAAPGLAPGLFIAGEPDAVSSCFMIALNLVCTAAIVALPWVAM